jgi:hypothetical protein
VRCALAAVRKVLLAGVDDCSGIVLTVGNCISSCPFLFSNVSIDILDRLTFAKQVCYTGFRLVLLGSDICPSGGRFRFRKSWQLATGKITCDR